MKHALIRYTVSILFQSLVSSCPYPVHFVLHIFIHFVYLRNKIWITFAYRLINNSLELWCI